MTDKTIYLTVGSVLLAVAGYLAKQAFPKMILDPINDLKKTIGEISSTLLKHQAKITNATLDDNIGLELKDLSAALLSNSSTIRWYIFSRVLSFLTIPTRKNVILACHELNHMYHMMVNPMSKEQRMEAAINNVKSLQSIQKLLNISTNYELH